MELGFILLFVGVLIVVAFVALLMWGMKHALALVANSIIGFFALYAVQAYVLPELVINVWSVLFVALFGLAGLLIVLLLHWLGIWF